MNQIQQYEPQRLGEPHQQSQVAIIQGEDGQLYEVRPVTVSQLRRQQRDRQSWERTRRSNQLAFAAFGIGAVFLGGVVLLILGTILAAATRPPAPAAPSINENCIIACGGVN